MMDKARFLNLIEELIEVDPGTLVGTETLVDVGRWDSLAVMGFIALLDEHFSKSVPATKINACVTVNDLAGLVGDQIV